MGDSENLLALAALLERAYRLALDVQDLASSTATGSRRIAAELIDVLDDARVSLLRVHRSLHAADLPPLTSSSNGK